MTTKQELKESFATYSGMRPRYARYLAEESVPAPVRENYGDLGPFFKSLNAAGHAMGKYPSALISGSTPEAKKARAACDRAKPALDAALEALSALQVAMDKKEE